MDILLLSSIISKFFLYLGVLFAVGTVMYVIFFETDKVKSGFPTQWVTLLFAAIGIVSALVGYGIRAANLTGSAASMFDSEILTLLWQTPVGTALALRVLGLTLILVNTFTGKLSQSLAAIGCLIVLGSFTQIGHTTDISGFLSQFLLLIHLIGIALWVGMLLPLYRVSSNPSQMLAAGEIAHRFGQFAIFFVPTLLIAGGWLAYQLLNSLENLFTTGYGQTLLIKVVAVVGLLGLAAINKLRFVPALRANDATALKHLNKSVFVEIVLSVLILLTTAALTSALTLPELQTCFMHY